MRLIGLAGAARSGKDTVGRFLVEDHGFTRVSFADELRAVALACDPILCLNAGRVGRSDFFVRLSEVVERDGWESAKDHPTWGPEVRRFLQKLGTEGARDNLGENTWVDAAFQDLDPQGSYVFTDVRFPNEACEIWARGGEVWKIDRPGVGPVNGHASESALDGFNFDRYIWNGGTVDHLRDQIGSVPCSKVCPGCETPCGPEVGSEEPPCSIPDGSGCNTCGGPPCTYEDNPIGSFYTGRD